jgi:hypothetical protein
MSSRKERLPAHVAVVMLTMGVVPCAVAQDATIFLGGPNNTCTAFVFPKKIDTETHTNVTWHIINACNTEKRVWLSAWTAYACASGNTGPDYPMSGVCGPSQPVGSGGAQDLPCLTGFDEACSRYSVYLCDPTTTGCQPENDPEIEVHRGDHLLDRVRALLRQIETRLKKLERDTPTKPAPKKPAPKKGP